MAKYDSVNGVWPEVVPLLTKAEARTALKRLWRKWLKLVYAGDISFTTGRRYTRIYTHSAVINLATPHYGGWRQFIHSLSHHVHRRLHRNAKPHDDLGRHAAIEREMIAYVIGEGWLDGKLKREPKVKPKPDLRLVRAVRVRANIERWERKKKRAETALKKLRRQAAYYERTLSA